ncbi:hypothetical protein [Diaminobutyricimonas sp. LJ205]|uniref:hypothetical protein n=1 Tax=Diaminobutyricimonas sp. LJ205 TaxID=2683590 RepID=UPI0012F523B9|nr:hypothetical protein [Diaminobutyricimonas sp. LJ205]
MIPQKHTLTATVDGGETLEVISGRLTLDDTWSPYAQATLTIVTPADLAAIDPRQVHRVKLTMTRDLPTAQTRTLHLHIRARTIRLDGTTELQLASDDAWLHDLKWPMLDDDINIPASPEYGLYATVAGLVNHLATVTMPQLGASQTITVEVFPEAIVQITNPDGGNLLPISTGQSLYEVALPYLQANNLRLYADGSAPARLKVHGTTRLPTAAWLTVQTGVDLTDARDEINRDSDLWADSLTVHYTRGNAPVSMATWPPVGQGPVTKHLYLQINAHSPWTQFMDPELDIGPAMEAMFNRLQKRGRLVPVDAISDYSANAGQNINVTTPLAPPLTGVTQSIEWRFPDHEMTVTIRDLTEATP